MQGDTQDAIAGTEIVVIDGRPYRRHMRGGGLVALTAQVDRSAYIDRLALVKDQAVVAANVRLFHHSIAEEQAMLLGMTTLRDNARVGGSAVLRGVNMKEDAYVGGRAYLEGVSVEQHARVVDVDLRGRLRLS